MKTPNLWALSITFPVIASLLLASTEGHSRSKTQTLSLRQRAQASMTKDGNTVIRAMQPGFFERLTSLPSRLLGPNLEPPSIIRSGGNHIRNESMRRIYPIYGMPGPEAIATVIWDQKEPVNLLDRENKALLTHPNLLNFESRASAIWEKILELSESDLQNARIQYVEQSLYPSSEIGESLRNLKTDFLDFVSTTDMDSEDDIGKITHPLLKQIAMEAQTLFIFGFGEKDKPRPLYILDMELLRTSNQDIQRNIDFCESQGLRLRACKTWNNPSIRKGIKIFANAIRFGAFPENENETTCADFGLFPSLNAYGLEIQKERFATFCATDRNHNGLSNISAEQKLALQLLYWRMILPQ